MTDDKLREALKERYNWTDEQIDRVSPGVLNFFQKGVPRVYDYKMVAEVVKSDGCAYKFKIGDKYVFASVGQLLPRETTCPSVCPWAIAPMVRFSYIVYDRLSQGLELEGLFPDHLKCYDTGVDCGGFGEVLFRMYCVKERWAPEDVLLNP